jgi:hypothetical protein
MSISKKNKYSILVNTCDKFEDCWFPFFKLFTIYWPNFEGKIYLNTEYKDFSYPGLDIVCTKVCEVNKIPSTLRATWSQCLYWALEAIDSEIILYMQEDYFLKGDVKNDILENFVQLMQDNIDIDCIQLTDQGSPAENESKYDHLWTVPLIHQDRVSCQAALWKKSVLQQYIRRYETAWNFEWWGSKRAAILKHNFYVVDKTWVKLNTFEIIPYIFTAVIGGRWFKEVVPLCKEHNITINYSERGFFERTTKTMKQRIKAKIIRLPIETRSFFGLILLKLK